MSAIPESLSSLGVSLDPVLHRRAHYDGVRLCIGEASKKSKPASDRNLFIGLPIGLITRQKKIRNLIAMLAICRESRAIAEVILFETSHCGVF
jgi:hypothetical protein